MEDLTGIGQFGKLGQDIVELVQGLLNDLEPIRTFNTMKKLTDKIRELCQAYPNVVPASVVHAFFGNLPEDTKNALAEVVNEELGKAAVAQPNVATETATNEEVKEKAEQADLAQKKESANPDEQTKEPTVAAKAAVAENVTNNLKINTMNKLTQLQLNLAQAIAAEALLVGSFIGKGEAFIKAFLNGFEGVADNATVTEEQLIASTVSTAETVAIVCGKPGWAKMMQAGLQFYQDMVKNGKMSVLNFFHALISVGPEVKQLEAQLKGKTVDPNLAADELAVATDLGQLAKMYAIYFGGAATQPFLDAITTAVSGGVPTGVTVKQLVDGGFAIVQACAALFSTNAIFGIIAKALQSVYDDLAAFNVQQLWGKLKNFEAQLTAAKAQVSGGHAILSLLTPDEKTQLSNILSTSEALLVKILPAEVGKNLTSAAILLKNG